jgi:hypothetical protein
MRLPRSTSPMVCRAISGWFGGCTPIVGVRKRCRDRDLLVAGGDQEEIALFSKLKKGPWALCQKVRVLEHPGWPAKAVPDQTVFVTGGVGSFGTLRMTNRAITSGLRKSAHELPGLASWLAPFELLGSRIDGGATSGSTAATASFSVLFTVEGLY